MKSKLFQNQVFKRQNFQKSTFECNINIKLELVSGTHKDNPGCSVKNISKTKTFGILEINKWLIEQVFIFHLVFWHHLGTALFLLTDNNLFPYWVKQYDSDDWAKDWKSRTPLPNLILPVICSLTSGKEFHFSFLI